MLMYESNHWPMIYLLTGAGKWWCPSGSALVNINSFSDAKCNKWTQLELFWAASSFITILLCVRDPANPRKGNSFKHSHNLDTAGLAGRRCYTLLPAIAIAGVSLGARTFGPQVHVAGLRAGGRNSPQAFETAIF